MMDPLDRLKTQLHDALQAGLTALDPIRLVERALPPLPPKHARVRVIAAGKAASAMARGAINRWGSRIEDVLVVAPSIQPRIIVAAPPRVDMLIAAHPLPDERSVLTAQKALARAASLERPDLLLALISGGASSLLSLPPEGMSLEEKRHIVAALLESGADIRDVNTVRRHLSQIKGGRLALAASPARVLSLILSDVVNGEVHDIGSGPTVFDPTTRRDAEEILRRISPDIDLETTLLALSETLKPNAVMGRGTEPSWPVRAKAIVLAAPESLAQAIADTLSANHGFRSRVQSDEAQEAGDAAQLRQTWAAQMKPGEAIVIPCEPTLRLPKERGNGGRAGWIALKTMMHLPKDVVLMCAASDGVDGSSGQGGATVCAQDAERIDRAAIEEALLTFNDAAVHQQLGTHIQSGPTGHNLADVHVLARLPL